MDPIVYSVCSNQGETFFNAGKVRKAKKRISYLYRHIMFLNQIIESGKITDKKALNKDLDVFFSSYFEDWASIKKYFDEEDPFKKIFDTFKNHIELPSFEITPNKLALTNYLMKYPLETIDQTLSIKVTYYKEMALLTRVQYYLKKNFSISYSIFLAVKN